MRKLAILVVASILISSCVSSEKHNRLKIEFDNLKTSYDSLKVVNDSLNFDYISAVANYSSAETELRKLKEKNRKTKQPKYFTEEQALDHVKDHFDFYDADTAYRNVRVRRSANNVFIVSLEQCLKEYQDEEFFWGHKNYTLSIYNNGTYRMN